MSVLDERYDYLKSPYYTKPEYGDFTPFYVGITICSVLGAVLFIINIVLGCCSTKYKGYWNNPHTGNRWIIPLWTSTPSKQPPLDLTELDQEYLPPQKRYAPEQETSSEYLELHKRESDI